MALLNAEVSRNMQASKATQGEGRGGNHGQEFGVIFKSKSCVNINGAGSERENPAWVNTHEHLQVLRTEQSPQSTRVIKNPTA